MPPYRAQRRQPLDDDGMTQVHLGSHGAADVVQGQGARGSCAAIRHLVTLLATNMTAIPAANPITNPIAIATITSCIFNPCLQLLR